MTAMAGFAVILFPFGAAAEDETQAPSILVTGHLERTTLAQPNATGSRLGLTPLETPASITTLEGDIVRARGDQSIADAVSRAPGISNAANLGNGNTALAARGFSGQGSVLQLVDGVRLFPAAGTITFPTDPWMVEQIDILSGPASVLYGQGALGGAVNVINRKPNEDRTVVDGELGYGSQRSFHAALGVGGPANDQLSYRVDGSYRRSDGFVDRGQSRSLALSGTLRWKPVDTLAVTARHDYGDQRPMEYFGTPLIDGKLDSRNLRRNYNVTDGKVHFRDNRTTLQIDWQPSEAIMFSNQSYRLTSKRFWRNLESYCWVASDGNCPNGYNGTPGTPGSIYRTDNIGIIHDQVQWGDQGSVTFHSPLADAISNDLVAGFDVNSVHLTYSHDFGSDPQISQVDPFTFNPGLFFDTQGIAPRYRTRTREYAFFAEDRLKLGESVSLVAGVRYEHNRVRRWTIGTGGGETLALTKTLANTTWRIGAVYHPRSDLSLYAQYSTGVDPLGTLTTYSGGQVRFSHATGDQVEIGTKAQFFDGRGSATLAAYRIVKKGLLVQRTLASPIEQVGQRSAKGIEAAFSLELPAGFGIDANGTILDARFDDFASAGAVYSGNTPPNIPETAANLWLRWDVTGSLQLRGGLRHVGASWSDNGNAFRIPGYTTIDASASYALAQSIALDVRIFNLTDKAYAVTSYNDQQWIVGRPGSVDVTIRAAF
ncbi:TonB-dependent receptor [Sphingobium cupriresistens]|uniref:TonB-dependent receptor n=2 Tax=Sphingobium cupriresistens TaxID=1132417 RepID=A0A8G2DUZ6_9SPHN|nr:TonB-dependent receptor [Sphingobium cupriresistens]